LYPFCNICLPLKLQSPIDSAFPRAGAIWYGFAFQSQQRRVRGFQPLPDTPELPRTPWSKDPSAVATRAGTCLLPDSGTNAIKLFWYCYVQFGAVS